MNATRAQKASLLGSLMSAVLASICCLGPIVLALLGIGGAGFILKFEAHRPYFAASAAVLLGVAFYLTYRKKPAEACEPGAACASPKAERLNRIVLWIAAILVAFFVFFPEIISWFEQGGAS